MVPRSFDGATQDVAGGGVDVLYFVSGEGVGFSRGMDAGGEEDLVHVDVAEAGHYGLVEKQGLHAALRLKAEARYSTVKSSEKGSGPRREIRGCLSSSPGS